MRVLDREFAPTISADTVRERVAALASDIMRDMERNSPSEAGAKADEVLFLAMLNGSFVFAADLMRLITVPACISFVKMASYEGTERGANTQLIGLNEDIEGKTVIIIEDIIDTGLTMQTLLDMVWSQKPKEVKIAALFVKPDNLKVKIDIDYTAFNIPNDFIIGYGMDYNGYGRNLPDIYTATKQTLHNIN